MPKAIKTPGVTALRWLVQLMLVLPCCATLGFVATSPRCMQAGTAPTFSLFAYHDRDDKEIVAVSSRRRRGFVFNLLASSASVLIGTARVANASETVGKDENCDDASCLGVWDGLLADCPHGQLNMKSGAGCVSSQDDTPGVFAEPWDYSEAPNDSLDYEDQIRLLKPSIELVCSKRGDTLQYLVENGRYLRVVFTDSKTKEKSVGEFYFTPNDSTVQFRIGTLTPGGGSAGLLTTSLKNMERAEMIRKQCRYTKIPVLRNRKRSFIFGESGKRDKGLELKASAIGISLWHYFISISICSSILTLHATCTHFLLQSSIALVQAAMLSGLQQIWLRVN